MRTLSARILLGFIALMITFGVFATTIVWNLREIGDEASVILKGYVPLAINSAALARIEDDLNRYLDQGIGDAKRPRDVTAVLSRLKHDRDEALQAIVGTIDVLGTLVTTDGQAAAEVTKLLPRTAPGVERLQRDVTRLDALYATVLAAPPAQLPSKSDPSFQTAYDALDPPHRLAADAVVSLREAEKPILKQTNNLKIDWQRWAVVNKNWLADNEHTILMRAIYLGIVTVLLGLVITAWVAVTLRPLRRLREGARRIAAGDYGKRISETGPTEIADLAREFNSMGRAVQDREEEKLRAARIAIAGKMAGQVAHEVRNPLSSIGLNTELLEDELGELDSEARELCRKIRSEVDRLTQITEIYLGLRGGKPKLARESLNAIVDDLVGFVRKDLASRHVVLETELDSEDPVGHIDANQIRQCLINLVRNAADAVAVNGGGRVVVRTRSARGRVEVAVEDDGVGIAGEQLPRLFEPFFSTKKGGTGLGLALSQQIIQDHGGEIHVASRVGRGTTFTLSVPAG
jgi:signal transduction histidine kinase